MICTFFGYSDAPETVKPALKTAIIELMDKENVTEFYVGNTVRRDHCIPC